MLYSVSIRHLAISSCQTDAGRLFRSSHTLKYNYIQSGYIHWTPRLSDSDCEFKSVEVLRQDSERVIWKWWVSGTYSDDWLRLQAKSAALKLWNFQAGSSKSARVRDSDQKHFALNNLLTSDSSESVLILLISLLVLLLSPIGLSYWSYCSFYPFIGLSVRSLFFWSLPFVSPNSLQ